MTSRREQQNRIDAEHRRSIWAGREFLGAADRVEDSAGHATDTWRATLRNGTVLPGEYPSAQAAAEAVAAHLGLAEG